MYRTPKSILTGLIAIAIVLATTPVPLFATTSSTLLEGLLTGVDGRPALAHRVHLIDAEGRDVAQSEVDTEGVYSFSGLPAGAYSLGVESPQGQMAPVAAQPIRLGTRQLARRDIKLMQADPATRTQLAGANYGMGIWWAGLTTTARVWTVIGVIAVVGITVAAVDDDDDASPF